MIVSRDSKQTNFLEVFESKCIYRYSFFKQFRNYKIIYKRYAGLFFTICVDLNDNELTCLEVIYIFE